MLGLLIAGVSVAAFAAMLSSSPSARAVDRETCGCSCWDGAFKNGYSTLGYKTIHFSLDERLLGLTLWPAFYFLAATALARAVAAAVADGSARGPMLLALAAQVYPHHYSMWSGFNYLNEGMVGFMAVQSCFAATEVVATAAAAAQLSTRTPLAPRALWLMLGVAGAHIWHNSIDWTSGKWGMPVMLTGDALCAAVAAAYLVASIGRPAEPWFVPAAAAAAALAAPGAAAVGGGTAGTAQFAAEPAKAARDVDKAARDAAAAALRTAPRPIYSARDAACDGAATLFATTAACVALKALQEAMRD